MRSTLLAGRGAIWCTESRSMTRKTRQVVGPASPGDGKRRTRDRHETDTGGVGGAHCKEVIQIMKKGTDGVVGLENPLHCLSHGIENERGLAQAKRQNEINVKLVPPSHA